MTETCGSCANSIPCESTVPGFKREEYVHCNLSVRVNLPPRAWLLWVESPCQITPPAWVDRAKGKTPPA